MSYRSTRECIEDLERHGQLVRIRDEVDPNLEMAEIQRRAYAAGAPAILFEKVKGSPFPAVANLFGTLERTEFIFRKTLKQTQAAIEIKADPMACAKAFWRYWRAPFTGLLSLPKRVRHAPVMECEATIDQLPQIKSWPDDGGPFITLPQVYSEDPTKPGIAGSNIGMYRIQLAGNDYERNREIGVHYQIHRGIGIHHTHALQLGKPLKVAIFIGGPPAHTVAAVMPLPETISEVVFAGMLSGRRFRWKKWQEWTIAADADFCIVGTIDGNQTKPEGPFGDHLGYYSLKHDFPVMKVERVFHRKDAIWPFTVVGRPPQEDSTFGALIHQLTKPMVPVSLPGVKSMHAVDCAGVHPLLFVLGSERYQPYAKNGDRPQELLTQAHAVLGFNQASLAKYLWITDGLSSNDDPESKLIHDESKFIQYVLERVDWSRDLHFQTRTTIDTLDYSGEGLNEGSKLIIAARGVPKRKLLNALDAVEVMLPTGFSEPKLVLPGVIVIRGPRFSSHAMAEEEMKGWTCGKFSVPEGLPLVVVVDDSKFASESLKNWFWVTFTRSNPSYDVYGVNSFIQNKHWGANGSLIIDARIKPHHAPPLIEDPEVVQKVKSNWPRWFPQFEMR